MKLVFCHYNVLGTGTICVAGFPLRCRSFKVLEDRTPELKRKTFGLAELEDPAIRCAAYLESINACGVPSRALRLPEQEVKRV